MKCSLGGTRGRKYAWVGLILVLFFGLSWSPGWAQEEKDCSRTFVGLSPITDLASGSYEGAQGGLYPEGSNELPADHLALGLELAAQIQPLDANGAPDPSGMIGMISVGVSNTSFEFQAFVALARRDPEVNSRLGLVNSAQGGRPLAQWADVESGAWTQVDRLVARRGLTPAQVQVAWVKVPDSGPPPGTFPVDALDDEEELAEVLRILKDRFPNIKLAYLSSRIYGGYGGAPADTVVMEPFAYQTGFAVKWLIEDQILRPLDSGLNADPEIGEEQAPWIAWGPYLWADGLGPDGETGGIPGRSDGLEWVCDEFEADGIHPNDIGAQKVGEMLLDHFKSDPTSVDWFLGSDVAPTTTTAPTTPTTLPDTTRPGEAPPPQRPGEGQNRPPRDTGNRPLDRVPSPGVALSDPLILVIAIVAGGLVGGTLMALTMTRSRTGPTEEPTTEPETGADSHPPESE